MYDMKSNPNHGGLAVKPCFINYCTILKC